MKAKRTFTKMAHNATRAYYSADTPADVSDLRWMTVQRRIRKNLIVIRKIYGLNQKQCADLLGLNPKYINAMEKGRYYPSLRCLWLFSQIFYIPVELLVTYEWGDEETYIWADALMKMGTLEMKRKQFYENVRHNLIALRYAYGLSQNEVASFIGLSNSYMWALEEGRYQVSLPIAYAVSRLFHISVDSFTYHRFEAGPKNHFEKTRTPLNSVLKETWMQSNQRAAHNIQRLRRKNGLSVQQLADAIGYGREALYNMEQGKTFLKLVNVADVARFFDISIDSLIES